MSGETDQAGGSDAPVKGAQVRKVGKGVKRLAASSAHGSRMLLGTPIKGLRWAQERSLNHALAGQDVAIVYWPDPRSVKARAKGKKLPCGLKVGYYPGIKPLARIDFLATGLLAVAGVIIAVAVHSLITGALLTFLVGKHVKRWREANRAAAAKTETAAQKERRDRRRPEYWAMALTVIVLLVLFVLSAALLRTVLIVVMVLMGLYSLLANRLDYELIRADCRVVRVHGVFTRHTPGVRPEDIRFIAPFQWVGTPWGRVTIDTASGNDAELHGWGTTTYPTQWVRILESLDDRGVESFGYHPSSD